MNLNEIKLNHSELGYLMDISSAYSKEIICTCLEKDKVGVKDWVAVGELKNHFGLTSSMDLRYDRKNKLELRLEMSAENYKKYLNDPIHIKKLKFTGGKSIFYKILSPEQLGHALERLKEKHRYLYGRDSMDETYEKLIPLHRHFKR